MIFRMEVTGLSLEEGENPTGARCVLIALLQSAAQKVGSGHPLGTPANPDLLIADGKPVGKFWLAADPAKLGG